MTQTQFDSLMKKLDRALQECNELHFGDDYYENHSPDKCSVAYSLENRVKNCQNIWGLPFDDNLIQSIPHYINASPMNFSNHRYIAAQGPQSHTFNEFWHMIWAEGSYLIVSVTNEIEFWEEELQIKFECFWPPKGCLELGLFTIQCIEEKTLQEWPGRSEKIVQRSFEVRHQNEVRKIMHLHMENWFDNNVIHPESLIELAHHADAWKNDGPITVHCAAGIGRTGTFIAFHSLYHDLMQNLNWNILDRVREMRKLRWGALISTARQYELLVNALGLVLQKSKI